MVWTQELHILDGIWSSELNESWGELLAVTVVSKSQAEVIFRARWQLEIQTNAEMLWPALWLVVGRVVIVSENGECWLVQVAVAWKLKEKIGISVV